MLEDMSTDLSGAPILPEFDVVGHDPGLDIQFWMDLNVGPGTQRDCMVGTGRVNVRDFNPRSKVWIDHNCVMSQAFVLAG